MARLGRQFEEAVYTFVEALDPSAEVLFDYGVPDRDTGEPRQCDVWINAKFGGHWPISILVSCKDRQKSGRKLHSGDIGKFCEEVRSTGASTGVIYCNVGFTEPAVRKAKANGIACCRLYQNEPPDIPEVVWLEHFVCKASIKLGVSLDIRVPTLKTWNDLFNIEVESRDNSETILDAIVAAFAAGEEDAISHMQQTGPFPPDWGTELVFDVGGIEGGLRIQVLGHWKRYRARMEAILLDGSYCLSEDSFIGSLTGPAIHVKGVHPGDAWVEMSDEDSVPSSNTAVAILWRGDIESGLREGYGLKPLELRRFLQDCSAA